MADGSYQIQMSQSRLHIWHGGRLLTPEPLSSVAFLSAYRVRVFAGLLGMTPRRLHQCFVHDLGLTPKEWMRGERMVRARFLLREGRMVKDVAEKLGFTASRDFAREFQWFYGMSPTDFQRAEWKRARWHME
jgi:AraC-like DNA-binding protein